MFPVHLTAADVPFPAKIIGVLHRIFEQGLCQQCGTVPIRAPCFINSLLAQPLCFDVTPARGARYPVNQAPGPLRT